MPRRRLDEMQVESVMASVRSDVERCPIDTIHNDALNEYKQSKRRKQTELTTRRATSTIPLTKIQKKRDINHASAVASRNKHEFLLRQFESTLRRKLSEAQVLSDAYVSSRRKICEQVRLLSAKDNEIATLRNELAVYQARNQQFDGTQYPSSSAPQLPTAYQQTQAQQFLHFDASPISMTNGEEATNAMRNALSPTSLPLSTSPIHDVGVAMDEIISPISPVTYESLRLNKEQHHHQQQHTMNPLLFQWSSRMGEEVVKSDKVNPVA